MGLCTLRVQRVRAGQPRPYADSVWESVIYVQGRKLAPRQVKELARVLVHVWTKDIGETGHLGDSYLKKCDLVTEEYEDGVISQRWRVEIMEPFTD